MRPRSLSPLLLLVAFAVGTVGCAVGDPNVEGAKLNLRNGEYDDALTNVNAALATDPTNTEAYLLRVEVLRQQYEATPGEQQKAAFLAENYDTMVTSLQQAEQNGADPAALAQARVATWAIGINGANAIVRDPDAAASDAVAIFERANALQPDSSQGYLGLGLAYLRDGDATLALPVLERGTVANPDDPILAYYYGRSLLLANRPSDAVAYLEGVQDRFADDEDIQTILLNAYTASGDTERSIERYGDLVSQDPGNATYRYNYGALLLQAERYEESIEQLREATALAPDNSNAFYNLGAAYQNRAASFNEQANATEDADEANRLVDRRDEFLELSVDPLLQARRISAGTDDEGSVCEALFRVYTQLGRVDDAETIAECAGISMN